MDKSLAGLIQIQRQRAGNRQAGFHGLGFNGINGIPHGVINKPIAHQIGGHTDQRGRFYACFGQFAGIRGAPAELHLCRFGRDVQIP